MGKGLPGHREGWSRRAPGRRSTVLSPLGRIDIAATSPESSARVRSHVEARYTYADGEHDLLLRMRGIGDRHVEAVRQTEAEFALLAADPLLLLAARFGDAIPWSVASYCWHHVPRERRTLPPAPHSPEEKRAFLAVALAEAESGTIRATRNVTLSLDFTRALHAAIRRQAQVSWNSKAAARARADLDRRYPTAEALVAQASVRSLGNP
jgi:hypothetical protein